MTADPLRWPECRYRPSLWQRFQRFWTLGSDYPTWNALRKQQAKRTRDCLDAWPQDKAIVQVRDKLSSIIAECLGWPNPYFLPTDPCEILMWDTTPDLRIEEATILIEREFPLREEELWDRIAAITFGEFVQRLTAAIPTRENDWRQP
jgi:hypothetical protein